MVFNVPETGEMGNIVDALQDPKAGVRIHALREILEGAPVDIQFILPLVKDPNRNVRRLAISALGNSRDVQSAAAVGNILLREPDQALRKHAANQLGKINLPECLPYLRDGLADKKYPTVQMACVKSLRSISGPEVVSIMIEALSGPVEQNLRAFLVTSLGELRSPRATQSIIDSLSHDEPHVRKAALRSLYQIDPPLSLHHSLRLVKNDPDSAVRKRAVENIGNLRAPDGIPLLVQKLFYDPDDALKLAARDALARIEDWKTKVDQILQVLANSDLQREALDGDLLLKAMLPLDTEVVENKNILTDYLIQQTTGQDARMLAILAELIVSSAGGSMERAGKRLNDPKVCGNILPETLQELRIQIGGKAALDPIMQELRKDLDLYFQKPIHELNLQTQASWLSTIRYAQAGFIIRMLMSVAVFIIGIILLWLSSQQLIFGQRVAQDLFGPGITFIGGLGTMLLVIYSGPLKEIRQSINDLGAASAAFIAYIHRVLQISHTFSVYYMTQKITFAEMEKSSQMIGDAMTQTIQLLRQTPGKNSETTILEALKNLPEVGDTSKEP